MEVSNNCSRVIPDNECICKFTDRNKILRQGDATVIENVTFVRPGLSLNTMCQVEDDVTHKFVLTCNKEELVPRTTLAPATSVPGIVSGCPTSTLVLLILCVILAFIAIVLYQKLRKANKKPTANAED